MHDPLHSTGLNILLSAYACEPGPGSEENVGWDTAVSLATRHRVVVLTRPVHEHALEAALGRTTDVDLSFVYYDLPNWLLTIFSVLGKLGVEAAYYLWLKSARRVARELHRRIQFDTAQHVTYARYWMPTPLVAVDTPFIWGPVGGGESIPGPLRKTLSPGGRRFEFIRDAMRTVGERTPLVKRTARQAAITLANTTETAERVAALGSQDVRIENSAALSRADLKTLTTQSSRRNTGLVFASIGRLLDWKGFHLGIRAFAEADLPNASYFIVGDGPARKRLQALAEQLGVADLVFFSGRMDRLDVLDLLASVDALIHPSLHESGGFVCLEAMASGTPVVCLDIGGPGYFVSPDIGYPVEAGPESSVVSSLSNALVQISHDRKVAAIKGSAAQRHVVEQLSVDAKAERLFEMHADLAARKDSGSVVSAHEADSPPVDRNAVSGPSFRPKDLRTTTSHRNR